MKKILFLLVLILLATPSFGDLPTKYKNYEVIVELKESGIVKKTINIQFPEKADKFNIYLVHRAKDLKVFAGEEMINCRKSYEGAGTLVSCEDFNTSEIQLRFDCSDLITFQEEHNIYSDRFFVTTPMDSFNLKVYLPKGHILSEDVEQHPYYPFDGEQKTDGRSIYVEWSFNPALGEVYDVSISYEKALRDNQFIVVIVSLAIVSVMSVLFVYFRRQHRVVDIGLTEDERKVLNIITKGKKVTQKKIVKDTGFSKAHVSRLAKSLESRGLIERRRQGRNYEIVAK